MPWVRSRWGHWIQRKDPPKASLVTLSDPPNQYVQLTQDPAASRGTGLPQAGRVHTWGSCSRKGSLAGPILLWPRSELPDLSPEYPAPGPQSKLPLFQGNNSNTYYYSNYNNSIISSSPTNIWGVLCR